MHRLLIATITVLALTFSTVCAAEGVTADKVVIGQCAALEGPASKLGTGVQAGLKAAFAKVNAAGGVNGRQLELISVNDSYEPDMAIEGTLKLVEEDGVFVLAGYVGTPTAKAVLPIVQDMNVPLVGLFTGAGFLRQPVKPQIFNIRASYDEETETLVERMTTDLGIKRIAVFYQDDAFGLVGLNGTKKALEKRGLEVVGTGTYTRNTVAIKSGLASIIEAKPEAVVMVGAYKPIAAFVSEGKAAGLDIVYSTISFTGTEALIEELGDKANGMVISQVVPSPHDASLPVVADFQKALKDAGDTDITYPKFEGYINGKVLAAGIEKAGADLTRASLTAALESLKDVDLGGMTFSYSADNHQALNKVWLTKITDKHAAPVDSLK